MRRKFLFWGGLVAALIGLVWMGQGSGYFPYPEQSFMIDNSPWTIYGAILFGIGGLTALYTRPGR